MDFIVRPKASAPLTEDEFLGIPPYSPEAFTLSRKQLEGRVFHREEIARLLYQYNISIGNDAASIHNITELKNTAKDCILTGQQLGLMGGPSYTILKAMTCILLARETGSIPIFWAATEDHDANEIDHTYTVDEKGNLKRWKIPSLPSGIAVEKMTLDAKQQQAIRDMSKTLQIRIDPEASYSKTMMRFLAKLFAGTGLVFMEPYLLRKLAVPFYCREIVDSDSIQAVLQKNTQRLVGAGHMPVLPVDGGTHLFFIGENGHRQKIKQFESKFAIGKDLFTEGALIDFITQNPERFSTNVAARPVLQNLLLPVLAYVAGPTEIAYHRQLLDYHRWHGISMPLIVPRLSATVVTGKCRQLLEQCGLNPWDEIPEHWSHLHNDLGNEVRKMLGDQQKIAAESMGVRGYPQSWKRVAKKMEKEFLKGKKIPYSALHFIRNQLHPLSILQERVLNWCGFNDASTDMVKQFLAKAKWNEKGHYYLFLK